MAAIKRKYTKTFLVLFFLSLPIILTILTNRAVGQEQDKNLAPQQQASPHGAEYVGSETCAACHETHVESLKKSAHDTKGFHDRATESCETCHGPGSKHAESGDPADMISFKEMKPQKASEQCLQCHENGKQMQWRSGEHHRRNVSCNTCHSVHDPKSQNAQLKKAKIEEQCYTCHTQVKAQAMRTSHHPIREGSISCNDCHNPHGTQTPKMLTANSVNEQCYTCHTEKRGPFMWEHPPVKENCLTCHTPHGSSHPKLLASKRPYLCQQCHMDTRHPGTLYDAGNLNTSNREFARSCSNCHLTVHGSNHPSGWTFTR